MNSRSFEWRLLNFNWSPTGECIYIKTTISFIQSTKKRLLLNSCTCTSSVYFEFVELLKHRWTGGLNVFKSVLQWTCKLWKLYSDQLYANGHGAMVEWYLQAENKAYVRGGKPALNVTLSATSLTRTDVDSNPGFRSERPAIERLSHGTVWMCADGS